MKTLCKEERKNKFAELFDSQMETLKSRGCPQAILSVFRRKKNKIISKASEMNIPEGNIPFIPVIPRSYLEIYGLVPMVRNDDKVGCTTLDPNDITDQVKTPKGLYFIYDVEDGRKYLGKSPQDAERPIKREGRSCLTAEEGIMVCVLMETLSHHYVDCTGSRYRRSNQVPNVYLSGGVVPTLDWGFAGDSSAAFWGSASCRNRF